MVHPSPRPLIEILGPSWTWLAFHPYISLIINCFTYEQVPNTLKHQLEREKYYSLKKIYIYIDINMEQGKFI